METMQLRIDGMHCGACVRRVTMALENLNGVKATAVEVGSARVEFDAGLVQPMAMVQAVDKIGFKAQIAQERA